MKTILITGHEGLIGRHLFARLNASGYRVKGIDKNAVKANFRGDITKSSDLVESIFECDGIVHLAAVSRVVWGQQQPNLCWKTNAEASRNLITVAQNCSLPPWVLVASSREVYGEPTILPVTEDAALNPVNIYGDAKLAMERATLESRKVGLNTAIIRLANVYGCTQDHADRVIPAFCRAAAQGQPLRVDGMNHTFDFTHISDVIEGLMITIELLISGRKDLPPIHLLPGIATTLGEAAKIAVAAAKSSSTIHEAPPRNYDVARFVGDPTRALDILGWQAKISPTKGIQQLVKSFKKQYEVMDALI
jgi:nucleoside-diphosphate-sugar epimerase